MQDHLNSIAPDNHQGVHSDTSFEVTASDEQQAAILFQKAKDRLLDVNNWHTLTGTGTAVFRLTDEKGNEQARKVQLGDHFKIDIPGPGSKTGSGYDWVQVEAIEHSDDDNEAVVAIRVRPTDNPQNNKADVAHFFSEVASSTFSVTRKGKTVIAAVQGRNEKPNTKTGSVADKIRNTVVAAGAMLGFNKPQWKSLVKGLLG